MPDRDAATTLRAQIEQFVPDGFRDEDGVWHEGPHRRDAFAAVDELEAEIERLRERNIRLMELASRGDE